MSAEGKVLTRRELERIRKPISGPPKGQYKGPIMPGPAELLVCPTCQVGLRKRHVAQHLSDHRSGFFGKEKK